MWYVMKNKKVVSGGFETKQQAVNAAFELGLVLLDTQTLVLDTEASIVEILEQESTDVFRTV